MNKLLNVMLVITLVFSTMFTVGCGSDSSDYVVASDDAEIQINFMIANGSPSLDEASTRAFINPNLFSQLVVGNKMVSRDDRFSSREGYFVFPVVLKKSVINEAIREGGLTIAVWGSDAYLGDSRCVNKAKIQSIDYLTRLCNASTYNAGDIIFSTNLDKVLMASVNGVDVTKDLKDLRMKSLLSEATLNLRGDTLIIVVDGGQVLDIVGQTCRATVEGVDNNFKKNLDFFDVKRYFTMNDYRGTNKIEITLKPEFKEKLSDGIYNCRLDEVSYIDNEGDEVIVKASNDVEYSVFRN